MNILKLVLSGIILGVANVIPGVSGGTMAVVLNVYTRLLALVTINLRKIMGEWKFWLPLVGGLAVGVLIFARVIVFLMEKFATPTISFFVGLVLGSVPLIVRKIKSAPSQKKFPSLLDIILVAVGVAVIALMFILKQNISTASNVPIAQAFSFAVALKLFAAGFAAAVAMVVPGISGSLLLLLLGQYNQVMQYIADMAVLPLIPFAVGVLAGILSGAFCIRSLLAKKERATMAVVLGLVLGSAIFLFPFKDAAISLNFLLAIVFLVAGAFLSYLFSKKEE